jgi:DtxR family Mn-dependent transcriptional regulator
VGFSWDEVHDEAEVLEHFISEKLEARIAAYLDNPAHDPHGDPIPALDGTLPEMSAQSLADLPEKVQARIVRVSDQDGERLRYIAKLGLVPGASVQVIESAPFDGPISVQIAGTVYAIDRRLARMILVEES